MRYTYRQNWTSVSHLTLAIYTTRNLSAWLKYGRRRFSRITDSSLAGAGSVAGAGASTSGTAQISDLNQPGPSRALESQGQPNSELVQQGFGLFETYLTLQLGENGKQLKTQSKIEKEACELKSRGNRKQFEFNTSVDAILDITSKADSPDGVKMLANEGKEKI